MTTIEQTDKSLKTAGVTREFENDNLPPIRTTTTSSEESSAKVVKGHNQHLKLHRKTCKGGLSTESKNKGGR